MTQTQLETYTHDDLVIRAMLFAKISLNAWVAGKDIGVRINGHNEIADVWSYSALHTHKKLRFTYGSWLFEIKASRSDFLADLKKPHRQPGAEALGRWRTYYAAPGIIKPDEVPEGWGLIEPWGETRHRYIVKPVAFDLSAVVLHAEIKIAARLAREWELLNSRATELIASMGGPDNDEADDLQRTGTSGYWQFSNVIARYEKHRGEFAQ